MPSYLDLAVLAIVLVSALLSMLRGFSREVLAIASWAAAAAAAYYFYPVVVPYLTPYIHKEMIAQAVAAAIVFFATLIVVSLFTVRVSDAILDSKIGALDRTLGFVFGVARGFLLAVVAFAIFNWLVSDKQQPEWVKNAKTRPVLTEYRGQDRRAAAGGRGGDDRRLDQGAREHSPGERGAGRRVGRADPRPSQPLRRRRRPPRAQKKVESPANANTQDKQKLDALINKNLPRSRRPAVNPKQ